MTIPDLSGLITKEDVNHIEVKTQRKDGSWGSYQIDYTSWAKVSQLLKKHAPGWEFHLRHSESSNYVWAAPDGSGFFTEAIGALVKKDNLGFGPRSWRYSVLVNDGVVEVAFVEEGCEDDCPADPYEVSDPLTMMNYIQTESPVGQQYELNLQDGAGTDETFA